MFRPSHKVPIFLSDLKQIWSFSTDFHKGFYANPSVGRQTDGCTDGQTGMTNLAGAIREYSNAPNK
jgi:hypothetical protein